MSEVNVELTYRALDSINRRDLEALLALMDEDVGAASSSIVVIADDLYGHDGIRHWWEHWFKVFPEYEIEVVDIGVHRDLVIAELRALGHRAGRDLQFEDTIWLASWWRRRKCVWWHTFYTADEALEAAGLSE